MSDEHKQPDTTRGRRPLTDPRLTPPERRLSTVEWAAVGAGWGAALLLVVLLFWMAINRSFSLGPKIILGVTVALAVFWAVVHWGSIVAGTRTRRVHIRANNLIFVLLVLGILVLINVVAARHHTRVDLTENQRFSLSQQTREVVKNLEQDVTIIAFLSPEPSMLRDRLREYSMLSPRLKLEIYDPVTDREKVEEFKVMSPDTLVVKSGDRQEKVIGGEEEQLTSTILAVTSGKKTRIYFLTGHGERSVTDTGPRGLGTIKASLENQQYQVDELNLATAKSPKVPDDCAVLVIAGPSEPIPQKQMDAIRAYLEQGGNVYLALEPDGPDFAQLLEPYGIKPLPGMVYDPGWGLGGAAFVPMVADYTEHQITEQLRQIGVALPTARALEVVDTSVPDEMMMYQPPGANTKVRPLLKTSAEAWAESNPAEGAKHDPGEPTGPLNLAVLYDAGMTANPDPMGLPPDTGDKSRMIVVGDADMMTDEFISIGLRGNAYFVLNSINWLVANEKLISIPPKEEMPSFLTMNERQQKLVWVLVVGVMPLLVAVCGFAVWWRRR